MDWEQKVKLFKDAGNRYDRTAYCCSAVHEFYREYERQLEIKSKAKDGSIYSKFLVKRKQWAFYKDYYLLELAEHITSCYAAYKYWTYTLLSWDAKLFTFDEIYSMFHGNSEKESLSI